MLFMLSSIAIYINELSVFSLQGNIDLAADFGFKVEAQITFRDSSDLACFHEELLSALEDLREGCFKNFR